MTIVKNRDGSTIHLQVEGRVDAITSPQLQAAILEAFQTAKTVSLNMEKVPYMSSAGLRALLIGQKTATSKGAALELVHVTDPVMAVMDSMGFTQILTLC